MHVHKKLRESIIIVNMMQQDKTKQIKKQKHMSWWLHVKFSHKFIYHKRLELHAITRD